MERVDKETERARARISVSKKYIKTDITPGISQENIEILQTAVDDLEDKNVKQKRAVETYGNSTALENALWEKCLRLIRKSQNAARTAFGADNEPKMKEFHVGDTTLETTKGMLSELKYMKPVVIANKDALLKEGLEEADITKFDTQYAELDDANTKQNNAIKVQKQATRLRNDALRTLTKAMRKIADQANTVFADRPDILIEFEPVAEGRGGGKEEPPAAPPPSGEAEKK